MMSEFEARKGLGNSDIFRLLSQKMSELWSIFGHKGWKGLRRAKNFGRHLSSSKGGGYCGGCGGDSSFKRGLKD